MQKSVYIDILTEIDGGAFDGFWVWDLRDNSEHYSHMFAKTFGYTDEDLGDTAFGWQQIIFPEDRDHVLASLPDVMAGKKAYNFYVRYKHKRGHTVHIICRGELFHEDGEPAYIVGTHTDVTPLMKDFIGVDLVLTETLKDGHKHR